MPLTERFQKIDPILGAIVPGAKIQQHGAMVIGVKALPSWRLGGRDLGVIHVGAKAWRHRSWRQALA
jgi:hypothetical protein